MLSAREGSNPFFEVSILSKIEVQVLGFPTSTTVILAIDRTEHLCYSL